MSWAMAFAENAKQNGVHIYKEPEVRGIHDKAGYYHITTDKGPFQARFVVNAAGLFADDISKMIGAADFEISGWKAQLLVLENRGNIDHIVTATPQPQRGRMLIPTTHNSIVVAHTFDPMTDKRDWSTTGEALKDLITWPEFFIPSISRNQVVSNFSGFLTFNTKDPNDHLLEIPKKGFINAVVSAPGMGPAPAIAREVVRMLGGEGLDLVTRSDFDPYRYKPPRITDLPHWEKNERIKKEPGFGRMVCRCEKVSEQEVREAVRCGARTLDDIKFKTLAGFGRCQGGFCTSRVLEIMADELDISPLEITKKGRSSYILERETKPVSEAVEGGSNYDKS
jgi:glycerol-3-phosphate dehydrogenase